ncbi:unnamed protein product [Musa banksii]
MAWKHHTKQIMKPSISHGMTSFSFMMNSMTGLWVDCKVEIVGHSGDEHQLTLTSCHPTYFQTIQP